MAAVSAALGVAGCLASPRDRFLALVATGSKRRPDGAQVGSDALHVTARQNRGAGRRSAAGRIFRVALCANPRGASGILWFALAIGGTCFLLLAIASPLKPLTTSLVFQITLANSLAASNSRAAREFLSTRPIRRRLLLRAAVLPWVLLGLLLPAVALVSAATRTTVARDDLSSLSYARDTIKPSRPSWFGEHPPWLPGQLPVSPAIRSALVERVLGFGVLQLAWFLSFAAFGITNGRRGLSRERWTSLVLFLVAGALMTPTLAPWLRLPWGPPPIWVAGALAATGAYVLRRRLAVPG